MIGLYLAWWWTTVRGYRVSIVALLVTPNHTITTLQRNQQAWTIWLGNSSIQARTCWGLWIYLHQLSNCCVAGQTIIWGIAGEAFWVTDCALFSTFVLIVDTRSTVWNCALCALISRRIFIVSFQADTGSVIKFPEIKSITAWCTVIWILRKACQARSMTSLAIIVLLIGKIAIRAFIIAKLRIFLKIVRKILAAGSNSQMKNIAVQVIINSRPILHARYCVDGISKW